MLLCCSNSLELYYIKYIFGQSPSFVKIAFLIGHVTNNKETKRMVFIFTISVGLLFECCVTHQK